MEEDHLVEAKAKHEMALEVTAPCWRWLISERSVKGERFLPPRSAGSGQELSTREALRSLSGELPVRPRNYDNASRVPVFLRCQIVRYATVCAAGFLSL